MSGDTKSSPPAAAAKSKPAALSEPPIPYFNEYVPPVIRRALIDKWSHPVKGVPGLRLVSSGAGQSAQSRWPDILTADALAYVVDVYRASLKFDAPFSLNAVLAHRKMKRACLASAAKSLAASVSASNGAANPKLADVRLADGSVALGFRSDTASIRNDPSWRVRAIPSRYARFQDTMTGPPTPAALSGALHSGISFFMADFEDSSTVALESMMDGIVAVTNANRRTLDVTDANGVRHTVLPERKGDAGSSEYAELSIRFEGLHLPNAHFLVDGYPIPAHIVTVALYLWHNWQPLKARDCNPVFYIPKLERMEEGGYVASLYRAAEELLSARVGVSQYRVGTIVSFVIIEHCLAVFEKEELLYALRDYVAGANTGWHDYVASIGAVHCNELPFFQMPPKSNLQIVRDYLEAYQVGIVQTCKKRGAIPIGGMSGMVPPLDLSKEEAEALEVKITEAFKADFWSQVNRGMEGVWLAHPPLARVAKELIVEREQKLPIEYHAKPITHESMLVTSLQQKDTVVSEADLHRNISDALQYLASYLLGNGNVALTRSFADGTPIRLLDDAATLERSRREVASLVKWNKPIRVGASGSDSKAVSMAPVTESFLRIAMTKVFNTIKGAGPYGGPGVDIPFHRDTKNAYDAAFDIVSNLLLAPVPVDYFTVYTLRHLISPFRSDASLLTKVENYDTYPFLNQYPNLSLTGIESIDFVTNEAFAPASSLFRSTFPQFAPHTFGAQGQVYDGWETARHNISPPDYVEFTLKHAATIAGVNIDTAHFDGNHGIGASLDGLISVRLDHQRIAQRWVSLIDRSYLRPTARNFFHTNAAASQTPVRRLRLSMYPDGGIARLELYGQSVASDEKDSKKEHDSSATSVESGVGSDRRARWIASLPFRNGFGADFKLDAVVDVRPAPSTHKKSATAIAAAVPEYTYPPPPLTAYNFPDLTDFAALASGGSVIASSSSHYSLPSNMIKPNRAINMGDGWETKRMRVEKPTAATKALPSAYAAADVPLSIFDLSGPVSTHYNWTVVRLGGATRAVRIVLDTLHFRNNPPVAFSLEGCSTNQMNGVNFYSATHKWYTLVPPTNLKPHAEHVFDVKDPNGATTHVLLKIYPCGGVSRLRVFAATATSQPTASAKL